MTGLASPSFQTRRIEVVRADITALELDGLRHPNILGTIAGDDTVLVIPRSVAHVAELALALAELAELA